MEHNTWCDHLFRQNICLTVFFWPYGCFSLSVSSFWVLAGHSRCVIFLLLPHLSPSAFTALRPSEYWQCVAHGAKRGLGDVLAALRTTTRSTRQPHIEGQNTLKLNWTYFWLLIWKALLSHPPQDIFLIFFCRRMRLRHPLHSSGGGSGWLRLLSAGHGDYRGMGTI